MLKLGRVTKVKMLFLVVLNFDLFKFSAAILEKGLFSFPFCIQLLAFINMHIFFPGRRQVKFCKRLQSHLSILLTISGSTRASQVVKVKITQ